MPFGVQWGQSSDGVLDEMETVKKEAAVLG